MSATAEQATSRKPTGASSTQQVAEGSIPSRPTLNASVAQESGKTQLRGIHKIKQRAADEGKVSQEKAEEILSQRITDPHPSWADSSQTFRKVIDTTGVTVETDEVRQFQGNVLQAARVVGEYVREHGMPQHPDDVQLDILGKRVSFSDAMNCVNILGKMHITDSPNFTEAAMNRELDNDLIRFVAERIAEGKAAGQEIDSTQIILGLMGLAKAFVTEERFEEIITGVISNVHAAGADSLQEAVISTKEDRLVVHGKDGAVIITLGNQEVSAVLAQAVVIRAEGKRELSAQEQAILSLAKQLNATAVFLSGWKETMMVGGQVTFREDPITKILGPSVKQRQGCSSHIELAKELTADFPPVRAQDFVKRASIEGKKAQQKQPPLDQQTRISIVANSPLVRGEIAGSRDRIVGPNSSSKSKDQGQRPQGEPMSATVRISLGSGEGKSASARSSTRQAEHGVGSLSRPTERGEVIRPVFSQQREVVVGNVLRLAFRFADTRPRVRQRKRNVRILSGRVPVLRFSAVDRSRGGLHSIRSPGVSTGRSERVGKTIRIVGSVQREQGVTTRITKASQIGKKIARERITEQRSANARQVTGRSEQQVQTRSSSLVRSQEQGQASASGVVRSQERTQQATRIQRSGMQEAAATVAGRVSSETSKATIAVVSGRAMLREFQRLVREQMYGQEEAIVIPSQIKVREVSGVVPAETDVEERALEANKRVGQPTPLVITQQHGQTLSNAQKALVPLQNMRQQLTLQLARSLTAEGEFPVTDRAQASIAVQSMLHRLQQEAA